MGHFGTIYVPREGRHVHKCEECGCVFEHNKPAPGFRQKGHTCPVCGCEEYDPHLSGATPTHHDHHLRERDYENGSRDKGDESRFREGPD